MRQGLVWLGASIVVTLAAACGSTHPKAAGTTSTASTSAASTASAAYWLRTLPFNARVQAPAGTVGIATPELPAMIVAAAGSIWVFPHHVEFAYRVDPAKNRVLSVGTRRLLTFDDRHFRSVRPLQGGFFMLLPADR